MRKTRWTGIMVLAAAAGLTLSVWAAGPLVVVVEFATGDGVDKAEISKALRSELGKDKNITLVAADATAKGLAGASVDAQGALTAASQEALAKATGAAVLVSGRAFLLDGKLMLVGKITGLKDHQVFGETESGAADSSAATAAKLAQKVSATIEKKFK